MNVWLNCEIFEFGIIPWPSSGRIRHNQGGRLSPSARAEHLHLTCGSVLRLRSLLEKKLMSRDKIRFDMWQLYAPQALGVSEKHTGLIFDQLEVLTKPTGSKAWPILEDDRAARELDWRDLLLFSLVQTLPHAAQESMITPNGLWPSAVSDVPNSSTNIPVMPLTPDRKSSGASNPPVTPVSSTSGAPAPAPAITPTRPTISIPSVMRSPSPSRGRAIGFETLSEMHNSERLLDFVASIAAPLLKAVADANVNVDKHADSGEGEDTAMAVESAPMDLDVKGKGKLAMSGSGSGMRNAHTITSTDAAMDGGDDCGKTRHGEGESVTKHQLDRLALLLSAGYPDSTCSELNLSDVAPFWTVSTASGGRHANVTALDRVAEWLGHIVGHNPTKYPPTPGVNHTLQSPSLQPLRFTVGTSGNGMPSSKVTVSPPRPDPLALPTTPPSTSSSSSSSSATHMDADTQAIQTPHTPHTPHTPSQTLAVSGSPVIPHASMGMKRVPDTHKTEAIVVDVSCGTASRKPLDLVGADIVRIKRCVHSFVYILAPVPYVHIANCAHTTIFVSAVSRVTLMEQCERVRLVCASRRVMLSNCISCSLNLCVSTPTLVMGDSKDIQIGPYSAAHSTITKDLDAAGIGYSLEENKWRQWLDVTLLAEKESAEAAGAIGAPVTSVSDSLMSGSSSCSVIDPSRFSTLVVPYMFESDGIESATLASPSIELPAEYAEGLKQKAATVSRIREHVRNACIALPPDQARALQDRVESQFHEWLAGSGRALLIRDLIRDRSASSDSKESSSEPMPMSDQ